jgi:hypothetical protein
LFGDYRERRQSPEHDVHTPRRRPLPARSALLAYVID